MEDTQYNFNYKKYKYKVKMWEKDFKKKNGRVPSKVFFFKFSNYLVIK